MTPQRRVVAATFAGLLVFAVSSAALAQKSGGILKVYHRDSPGSMSILEEATNSTEIPMMGVFNNLVLYKQDVPQNSIETIIPDLATSWSSSEDGMQLTFALRQGLALRGHLAGRVAKPRNRQRGDATRT